MLRNSSVLGGNGLGSGVGADRATLGPSPVEGSGVGGGVGEGRGTALSSWAARASNPATSFRIRRRTFRRKFLFWVILSNQLNWFQNFPSRISAIDSAELMLVITKSALLGRSLPLEKRKWEQLEASALFLTFSSFLITNTRFRPGPKKDPTSTQSVWFSPRKNSIQSTRRFL